MFHAATLFLLHGWQGDRGAGPEAKLWLLPLPPGRSFSGMRCQVLPRDLISPLFKEGAPWAVSAQCIDSLTNHTFGT